MCTNLCLRTYKYIWPIVMFVHLCLFVFLLIHSSLILKYKTIHNFFQKFERDQVFFFHIWAPRNLTVIAIAKKLILSYFIMKV